MGLVVYNTLTKQKTPFRPIQEGQVKMYVCGPTVYNYLHVGNFRGAIFFNLVRNWFEHKGLKVTFVYNYTDVDDKIINRANQEGVDSMVISERYIQEFKKDFSNLGLKPHDHNPKVTDFMPQIISFIDDLIKNQVAYVVEGEVFYDIQKFNGYGKLSGKKIEELEAGQRVEVDTRKRNPQDFVLWKPSKPGEPSWKSPWSSGRPGWHIECSAMIQSILGNTIDIHGGGIDLIFPHHENEIAQGEGRTKQCYCNVWMHNNFLNLNDEKMSKSLGNIITAREFNEKYHPEILKYIMLSSHYRALFNLNQEKVHQTISALARIYSSLREAEHLIATLPGDGTVNSSLLKSMKEAEPKMEKAMDDDFNTVEYLAHIFEVVRLYNGLNLPKKTKDINTASTANAFKQWLMSWGKMAALFQENPEALLQRFDDILLVEKNLKRDDIDQLVAQREEARKNKDWKKSDEFRVELDALGVAVFDRPDGVSWEMKKT